MGFRDYSSVAHSISPNNIINLNIKKKEKKKDEVI